MRNIIYKILIIAFTLTFVVSGIVIGRQLYQKHKAMTEYDEISTKLDELIAYYEAQRLGTSTQDGETADAQNSPGNQGNGADSNGSSDLDNSAGTNNGTDDQTVAQGAEQTDPRLLAYRDMNAEYPDFIGWIRIADTQLDYPVMQTPRVPEYYLSRNYNRQKSGHGTPFLDAACDINRPSDNMIIYGHNMNDGTMFATLNKYKDYEFFEQHPLIEFHTLNEIGIYEVVAAFIGDFTAAPDSIFYYNHFSNFYNEDEFDSFIENVRTRSIYDMSVTLSYGDQLLTLSTCEYTTYESRMVVLARRIT